MRITKVAENSLKLRTERYECSFHRWYQKFEKISIPSTSIRIPPDVLEYLRDEIVILPKECYTNDDDRRPDSDFGDDGEEEEEEEALVQPEFPEFSGALTQKIAELAGSVFLKTNWHCAEDAYWITVGQTLRVKDIADAYQLLKASSIVKDDLCNDGMSGTEYFVVLKEWLEIHSGTEFRCFVKNRQLIAISPRDWPEYHEHIVQQRSDIVGDIRSMFREFVKEQFPLDDFVFDVIRDAKDQIRLVDFSPFNANCTESLAFDWDELNDETIFDACDDNPEFRYLPNDCGIQPTKRNNYGIPQDIVEMFSGSGSGRGSGSTSRGNCGSRNIGSDLCNLTDLLAEQVENGLVIERNANNKN